MKNTMRLFLAVLLVLGFAVTSFALIETSKHDLSTGTTGLESEICAYCHTPHNAIDYETDNSYPLWSMVTVAATADFTQYASVTLDGALTDTLAGPSRLCMSCHDGVIAMDNAVNATPIRVMGAGSDANLGRDLTNDHPVGVVYDVVADTELLPVATEFIAGSGDAISDYLYQGLVTCASCHDVHAGEKTMFLLQPNLNSDLCLACHIK